MLRRSLYSAAVVVAVGLVSGFQASGQTAGLGIHPPRLEMEMQPGTQKTVSFEIESPPSEKVVRGRLLISLTDWSLKRDGSMEFFGAGTRPGSAADWVTFSPAAVSVVSGRRELVRVTVALPAGTKPGEYRTGLFIQERPPATPPARGEHQVIFRFRHFVSIYVMVPSLASRAAFTNVSIEQKGNVMRLLCSMKNDGSMHVRPVLTWSVRNQAGKELAGTKRYEGTVLLPSSELDEGFSLPTLTPGKYEIVANIDFHDKGPVQSITRTVEIAESAVPAAAPGVN